MVSPFLMMLPKVSLSPPWGPGIGKSPSNHLVHLHFGLQGVVPGEDCSCVLGVTHLGGVT